MRIRGTPGSKLQWNGRELPVGCSGLILLTALAYGVACLVVFARWRWTGDTYWVEQFFRLPSAILLIFLSGAQLWFSLRVCAEFSPGEPMLVAWQLIAASAVFDLAGAFAVQLLGGNTFLNPLTYMARWSPSVAASIVAAGHVLEGPFRFTLLAAGLFCALKLYRDSGFLGRLRPLDWAALAVFAAYLFREAADLIAALQRGKKPGWGEILLWPVDPLLCVLLAEALLLHRSVQATGPGLIGRGWRTFSVGIGLILLGDVSIWATAFGYLPWPWSSLGWCVWMPAAAAFALAPAYQLEAIRWAGSGQSAPPA